MKKLFSFAICAMAVLAMMFAMDSCKKDDQNVKSNNNAAVSHFDPSHITDMNAYLGEFKQKMKQSQYTKDNETLSLEEAAWHLSSVANYDFANANVEFTDLLYDTLYYQVDVTNGQVAMSDLNAVYADMSDDIDEYYQNLDLQDKHFRFIGASVSEDGQVRVSLTTSYTILDHFWHFHNDWEASLACYEYFNPNTQYVWNTTAKDTLEYAINSLEGRQYTVHEYPPVRTYYVYTTRIDFNYADYTDPYGSDFIGNSRIFAVYGDTFATPTLDFNMMCYCLDSFIGLPFEHVNQHINMGGQRPVHWRIKCFQEDIPEVNKWDIFYYVITVTFAQAIASQEPIQY